MAERDEMGRFVKGHKSVVTNESLRREKISKSLSGRKHSELHNKRVAESKKGLAFSEEHIKNLSLSHIGKYTKEKHPHWLGGISFEPYGLEFDAVLREKIRTRDNHTCQECGYTQKQLGYALSVHHIDFNKKNNNQNNLISLCRNCHLQTNFNRAQWKEYYQNKINSHESEVNI